MNIWRGFCGGKCCEKMKSPPCQFDQRTLTTTFNSGGIQIQLLLDMLILLQNGENEAQICTRLNDATQRNTVQLTNELRQAYSQTMHWKKNSLQFCSAISSQVTFCRQIFTDLMAYDVTASHGLLYMYSDFIYVPFFVHTDFGLCTFRFDFMICLHML